MQDQAVWRRSGALTRSEGLCYRWTIMMLVYVVVTICFGLLVLLQSYPNVVEDWLDRLVSNLDRWLDERADAAQSRLRERIERVEQRIVHLDEEQAALRWLQLALVTLPIGESGRQGVQ